MLPQKAPLVSVVMCTCNGAKYVSEQLDSILRQTCPMHELIIQDDCSTDNTFDILTEYARRHSCIRLYRNEVRKGVNENFFSAMNRAEGEFIAISDQDDIWVPDKIELQLATIGNKWLSSGKSKPFAEGEADIQYDERPPTISTERFIHGCPLPGHTLLIRKSMLAKVPRQQDFFMYDYMLALTAVAYDRVSFVDKVLVHNRRHLAAVTYTAPEDYKRTWTNCLRLMLKSFSYYMELRDEMRPHFAQMHRFLQSLPDDSVKDKAQRIALYQSQKGLLAYFKLTCLCVQSRKRIFYAEEKNSLVAILRAIYFPIYCSIYFRTKSRNYPKN